jgi:uncharacterized membrane protein
MGLAAIALGQSFSQFNAYMPSLQEVRKGDPGNGELVGDVRAGEVASLVGSLLVGLIVTWITGDPTPAYVSVLVCGVMVVMYEYILRAQRPLEGGK